MKKILSAILMVMVLLICFYAEDITRQINTNLYFEIILGLLFFLLVIFIKKKTRKRIHQIKKRINILICSGVLIFILLYFFFPIFNDFFISSAIGLFLGLLFAPVLKIVKIKIMIEEHHEKNYIKK